jgi:hypothetical protein
MRLATRLSVFLVGSLVSACGTAPARLTEVWDSDVSYASSNMQKQIKLEIFCELRRGAILARKLLPADRSYRGRRVTTVEDLTLPDSWGAQVAMTIMADEKTGLSPGITFNTPMEAGRAVGQTFGQSFAFGLGASASSQNIRSDKTNFYYTFGDLINDANPSDNCSKPPKIILGPPTHSSPFVDATKLGIQEWLVDAAAVTNFQRSSRASENGQGPPLGDASDSATYSNKFVIVTGVNATPIWNLVRVSTSNSPLIDLSRTRTHELIITIGPGDPTLRRDGQPAPLYARRNYAPSQSAINSHLASQIGSAVANAIRSQ